MTCSLIIITFFCYYCDISIFELQYTNLMALATNRKISNAYIIGI